MQSRGAAVDGNGVLGTDILGEVLFEALRLRPRCHPPRANAVEDFLFLFATGQWQCEWQECGPHGIATFLGRPLSQRLHLLDGVEARVRAIAEAARVYGARDLDDALTDL